MTNREYMMTLSNNQLVRFMKDEFDYVWMSNFKEKFEGIKNLDESISYADKMTEEWLGLDRNETK